jgi:hypothetical protein
MKLAAHQCNAIPWLHFFKKMQEADKFVLMRYVQFEKNGWTNRFKWKDKWYTIPVKGGMSMIADKMCMNGHRLEEITVPLIIGFARLLGIDTSKIVFDEATIETGTDRIIDYCRKFECDEYLTNPSAEEKYLDVNRMEDSGIKVIPFVTSNEYKISLFEALEKWGIEGTTKMLRKEWKR